MRLRARGLTMVLAGAAALATVPAAADTEFISPPLRSPSGGSLHCAVLNTSETKSMVGVSIGFRRVNGGTAGATSTCGDDLLPLTGCSATLAGFCEELSCACVFSFTKGNRKALRGSLMSVDGAGTVTGAVELHR